MSPRPGTAHLPPMNNKTQDVADFNTRQWRLVDFAVRKSCTWSRSAEDARVLVIERLGGTSPRSLVAYRAGSTRTGMAVAIIDPTVADVKKSLRFITQNEAWSILTEGTL